MLLPALIALTVFIAVILICIIIYYIWQKKETLKSQGERLEKAINIQSQGYSVPEVTGQEENKSQQEASDSNIRRDTRASTIPMLDIFLSKFPKERTKFLAILIEQSGLKIKVGEFLLISLFIGLLGALLVAIFFKVPFAGFIIFFIPFLALNILKVRRLEEFIKQLPQALDMLSSDLRAGLDIQTGLKHLSEEFPAPLSEEFAKVVVEVNLGLTLNEALNNLSTRITTMEVQILCTGIIINRELGGNLSELIGSVSDTVRERFRLKGMIKALTAENQMSGYLLIVLPFALYFILNMMSPDIYSSFSTDPIGKKIIIGCFISMAFGYFIMQKITKIEV